MMSGFSDPGSHRDDPSVRLIFSPRLPGPSVAGGLLLLLLFGPSASNAAIRAFNATISARNATQSC
jgi:hypothetical protein